MEKDGPLIPDLIRHTLREPRTAAQRILDMGFEAGFLWQALLLVVVLSVIAAQTTALITGAAQQQPGPEMLMPEFFSNPMLMGIVQGGLLVLVVFAVYWIGRSFGGTGSFEGAIALVTWLQFLLVCLQVAQALAALVLPPLAGLIGLAGLVVFFWLLTQFVSQLHGFRSPGMVFTMIVVSMLGIVFALSVVLAIIGVAFVGEVPDV